MKKLHVSTVYFLIAGMFMSHLANAEEQSTAPTAIREEIPSTFSNRKTYSAEQFLDTKSFTNASFSSDEKRILYTSDETGIFNIFSMNLDGSQIIPLTHSVDRARKILASFPNDERFIYECDGEGNELSHLWVREKDGNERDLIPIAGARLEFYGWSRDEKSFYYGSNQRDPRYTDLYEMDIETYTPKLLIKNEQGYQLEAISRDKRFAALSKSHHANNNELFLYDFQTAQFRSITPHVGNILCHAECFSADSRTLFYTTNEGADFFYLKEYSIDLSQSATVAKYDWDIENFSISYHGRYLVTILNQDARTAVQIYDQQAGSYIALPSFSDGGEIQHVKISKSEKFMLFFVNGSRSPSNLYLYNFADKSCQQLTRSLSAEINPENLVEAKIIRYRSYDGMEIPALYYQPHNIAPGQRVPALIWMHGGPGGQSTVAYNYLIQYLVNHGYAILAVNNRGSSGYGKSFFQAADLKHGEADLDDCIFAKQFLISTGAIDEERIGIIGGSYGGYLTLAALAFRPNEMAVGIDIFGVSNWIRTLQSIPSWWEAQREALYRKIGNPDIDSEYLISISPLFHADKIVKPLLVIQGANDPRVLQVESDQIVEAVTKNNVPCEYLLFEDEGHGFAKKINRQIAAESILQFLNKYLPLRAGEK